MVRTKGLVLFDADPNISVLNKQTSTHYLTLTLRTEVIFRRSNEKGWDDDSPYFGPNNR